jgi:hypoxanthine phosphoribosyltransferase
MKNKVIILVDDVLNSGKTLIFGAKPFLSSPIKRLTTAVLVDRGHNRYPIKADVVGLSLSTTLQEHISIELNKKGKDLYFKRPKKEDVEKFKKNADGSFPDETKQIYHEKRQDRKHSDDNLKKKYEEGGETPAVVVVEMSVEDMRTALGREPKYPYDFISGKKYVKCFLRPYYKCEE